MSKQPFIETLGAKVDIISGFAFPSEFFNQDAGLPLVRIRDLGTDSPEVLYNGEYDEIYKVHNGDLLIGMDGDFEVHKWNGGDALLNQRVCKVVSTSKDLDQHFLYWYLKPIILKIHSKTPQTTVRHLSVKNINLIEIPKFSHQEQGVVARILDTLDTTIRETEAIIAKLKAVKQGLLHDLLTRGLDDNGELRPPQSEAPHMYKQSPLGWIPVGWEARALGEVCSLIRDGTHLPPVRVADGPLLLSVRNMQDGQFILTDQDTRVSESFYSQMHKSWDVRKGDVLLAIVGATIGKTVIVGDMPKFTLQRSVAVLRGKLDKLLNPFLHLYIGSPEFQLLLWAQVNQTAQPGIYLDQLGGLTVPVPNSAEQAAIHQKLQAAQVRIDEESDLTLKLRKLKSGLMGDLLTGRVRVTPLLNDPPGPSPEAAP